MSKPRVTISYRFTRNDTTGVHCQSALNDVLGEDHVQFIDPDQFALHWDEPEADLHIAIDDDACWTYPEDWATPKVVWFIDTHTNLDMRYDRIDSFDLIYCAQLRGVVELRERSDRVPANFRWLPLAANPNMHYHIDSRKELDWAFVGHAPRDRWLPTDRADLLDILKERFPERYFAGTAFFDDMMVIFNAARVLFNRSIIDDINMRVFETMITGTPLLTNHLPEQFVLFRPNVDYVGYSDADEMVEKMKWLLDNPRIAKRIGHEGRSCILANHLYRHRMYRILEDTLDFKPDRHYVMPPDYEEVYREFQQSAE